MKTLISFSLLTLLTCFSWDSWSREQAADCPNNFKELEETMIKYEKEASRLWRQDTTRSQQMRNAANALERVLTDLGYGSRSDLGESEFISYVVFSERELAEHQKYISSHIEQLKNSDVAQEAIAVLKTASKKIPLYNLYGQDLNLDKLKCLGGQAYLTFIEESLYNKLPGFEESTVANYKKAPDRSWIQAIETLVKDEETLWGDTILEGEIGQNGPAEASEVTQVTYKGTRLLTRVTITAPAVFTGNDDCDYSDEENQWIGEECGNGSIYVTKSLDFLNQPIGSMDFAEFD